MLNQIASTWNETATITLILTLGAASVIIVISVLAFQHHKEERQDKFARDCKDADVETQRRYLSRMDRRQLP